MANRRTEQYLPSGSALSDFGEFVETTYSGGGKYALISFLTSPLTKLQRQDYVVFGLPDGAAATRPPEPDNYIWTVVQDALPSATEPEDTDYGLYDVTYELLGDVHVTVELLDGVSTLATLTLDQTVQDYDPAVEAHIAANASARPDCLHEYNYDLKDYINRAVVATGPKGVPSSLVAALLWQEGMMRYRAGSELAIKFQEALDQWKKDPDTHPQPPTGPDPGMLERWFGSPEQDVFREEEFELVASAFNALPGLGGLDWFRAKAGGKSIGLGQIRQTALAMSLCKTDWLEKPPAKEDPAKRAEVDEEIDSNYKALAIETQIEIFNLLRFPKSHVYVMADMLAKLKNRPRTASGAGSCGPTTTTRWPNLTRQQMRVDQRSCEVVATEYNMGASSKSATDVEAGRYGQAVWRWMTTERPLDADTFFPEPP